MGDSNFYDSYWRNEIEGGVLNQPPQWSAGNIRWHLDFFRPYCSGTVVDLGAGNGFFANVIGKECKDIKELTAIELSAVAIEQGAKLFPDVRFKQGSSDAIPMPDQCVDMLFAIEVVEHLLDVDQCFSEIARVLKPGGYFGVTTTDFNWPKQVLIAAFCWNKYFYPNNPHIRFFTRKTLAQCLARHGLSCVRYQWNRSYYGVMPKGQMAVFQKGV